MNIFAQPTLPANGKFDNTHIHTAVTTSESLLQFHVNMIY